MSMRRREYKELKKEIMHHACNLQPEEHPIIRYINNGYFVYFRRVMKNLILVNERNPRARNVFHSKASIRRECERHLEYYYLIIHPFSILKLRWEVFMVYFIGVSIVFYPLLSYADNVYLYVIIYIKLFMDFIYLFDIVITFNSGYLNIHTSRVHLGRKESAMYYLKKWFPLDLICTLNIDLFLMKYNVSHFYLKLINCVRILRIASLMHYLQEYREIRKFTIYKFNFFRILLLTLVLILWLTSFLYLLTSKYPEQWINQKLKAERITTCLYRVTYLFFLIGYGEGYSNHNFNLIFEMVCWVVGIIMRFFIIAEIVQIVSKYHAGSDKYHQRIQRLRQFMRRKGLPAVTCNRIIQYFDFRFQKTFYREDQILATLSTQLQQEIMVQICKSLIENVIIFKDLPMELVLRLVSCMKSVIYLPNDVIVQAGTIGKEMYFIHNGTVAVYTDAGIEVCHLTDGSNFGEVSMVTENETRIATVIAVDSCELYILSREDFERAIHPYPDLYKRMCRLARDRILLTMARTNFRLSIPDVAVE